MRTMYDSVTASRIPSNATMVAGYCDQIRIPKWTDADWALFPNAIKVRIAKLYTTNDGHVLDVENGDSTPAQSVLWVKMRRAGGFDPTVYCNSSTWPLVKADFSAAGEPQPHYFIAEYDGDPTIPAGAIAKQWKEGPLYDTSSVADFWPGVDTVAIGSTYREESDMTQIAAGNDVIAQVPTYGHNKLRLQAGFGHQITGKMWFVSDTNPNTNNGSYVGKLGQPIVIDSDRPGPITIPNGCSVVSLQVSCAIPFTAWCAD